MVKQKPYSFTDKLAVITSIKHGESQANVSCDKGVPKSTICGWLREKEKLCVDTVDSTDWMKRKKATTATDPQLIVIDGQAITLIGGPVLSIHDLHVDSLSDFDVSKGWLHHL